MAGRPVRFGYNAPTGHRGFEDLDAATFVGGLQHVLDFVSQHFSSIWLGDHVMTGDKFRVECWTQLTWMAARFPRPMLGTLVMANSYRHPPLLAKMAASLQLFSHGRFILGYGGGWTEEEYRAFGWDYPSPKVRIAQMVEGIEVIRALWAADANNPAQYDGRYYRLKDAFCVPSPNPLPPIMIGGDGERHLLRAVATHADWWSVPPRPIPVLRQKMEVLKEHCKAVGRDFDAMPKTVPAWFCLAPTMAEARRLIRPGVSSANMVFAGDPPAAIDFLRELIDVGFDQVQCTFVGFPETDDIKLFVDKVMPAFL
jgi:alkanesulfonate monooxygenase SsuD/methylene tetrahydromethanopterin reductase-like flavin-dependent oxidoreductase (luciferase family)